MTACAYCGRDNDAGAQFCMDCGKPLGTPSAVKTAAAPPPPVTRAFTPQATEPFRPAATSCPFCGTMIEGTLSFCPQCGRRLKAPPSGPSCARCGSPAAAGARFCPTCGATLDGAPLPAATAHAPSGAQSLGITLLLLDEGGGVQQEFMGRGPDLTVGRQDGDVRFPDDAFLSPLHAKISREQEQVVVRDLGSRNGTWVFLDGPHRLVDGDLLLVGSQVIRFRRLGYPGPHAPEADSTKRMGSLTPSADIACLTQLRSDGSARDVIQLSPGRDIQIGREHGDWTFPYDPSMSGLHATVRSEDADFVVIDANSRNGVALAARGDVELRHGSRLLVGDKLFRIEFAVQ